MVHTHQEMLMSKMRRMFLPLAGVCVWIGCLILAGCGFAEEDGVRQPLDLTVAGRARAARAKAGADMADRATMHYLAAREAIADLHPKTARREIDALRALASRWSAVSDLEQEYQQEFDPVGYAIRHPADYAYFLLATARIINDRDYDDILRLLDGRDAALPPEKELRDELHISAQGSKRLRAGFVEVAETDGKEKKPIRNFARIPGTREILKSPDSRFAVWWDEPTGPSNILVLAECGITNVSRITAFQQRAEVMWSPDSAHLAIKVCLVGKPTPSETSVWIVDPLKPEAIVKCEDIAPDELKRKAGGRPLHFSFLKWHSSDILSLDCFVVTTNAILPVSSSSWFAVKGNGFWRLAPDLLSHD